MTYIINVAPSLNNYILLFHHFQAMVDWEIRQWQILFDLLHLHIVLFVVRNYASLLAHPLSSLRMKKKETWWKSWTIEPQFCAISFFNDTAKISRIVCSFSFIHSFFKADDDVHTYWQCGASLFLNHQAEKFNTEHTP